MASTSSELRVVTSFQHLPKNRILVWYAISRRSFFGIRTIHVPKLGAALKNLCCVVAKMRYYTRI
jgi:hypothetical protein